MKSDTLLIVGGCAGSAAAPTETRAVYDTSAEGNIRKERFLRTSYGSRTSSFLLRHRETLILVDQGLGVQPLSEFLIDAINAEGLNGKVVHCLQTHYHEDHLDGLRSNSLLFQKGGVLRFYSPDLTHFRNVMPDCCHTMEDVFATQFCESYWPVTLAALSQMGAFREHVTFLPGASFMIDSIAVKTISLQHPGGCTGFRFEIPGTGSVVLATDYEVPETPDPNVVEFFEDATFLLADMQYRDTEYEGRAPVGRISIPRLGWGHSTPGRLFPTILACKGQPERVRITHHDPKRSDQELDLFCEESARLLESSRTAPLFDYGFARDGDVFWL